MHATSAISIQKVSKDFRLPHDKQSSVKSTLVSLFRSHSRLEHQHALHDISFDIKPGEFFGIVGRNGSGKSTLLKILAGIYQPSKGSVSVNGKLVPFIELGVGFNPELTGRENVFLNGALLGFSPKEVQNMYHDIVAFAELERFMDQKLKNYSSGMQVRLAFSVAIMAEADILLIDEVLAVGDADFQRKCFDYFKSLKKHKKTVVFVSHDMSAVREYCDRAILINESRLVAEGSADEIAEQYTRLFVEEEPGEDNHTLDQKRWGDGAITVEKVQLPKKVFNESDETISLSMSIKAHKDLDNPIAGFSVKDAADNLLFGTNTKIKKHKLGAIKKGERRTITWSFPNILADGRHFVNATVEYEDGITVCDWLTEAASFNVHKTERTAYHITPPIDVTITDK